MDVKAKTSVVQSLSDSILETILDKTKAKDIMSTVEKNLYNSWLSYTNKN